MVALFIIFVDVVYVGIHYMLNIQISDYWLIVNVIFFSIEILSLTAVNIAKKIKPSQKETYKEIASEVSKGIAAGVVTSISDNISLPDMSSGYRGHKAGEEEEQEEDIEDYEESGEALG